MSVDAASLTTAIVALFLTVIGLFLVVRKENDIYTDMGAVQREACRRLVLDEIRDEARETKLLGTTLKVSVRAPRLDFSDRCQLFSSQFDEARGTQTTLHPENRRVQTIADHLVTNARVERNWQVAGSTAYSLAVMLFGAGNRLDQRIDLLSGRLRFDGSRCLFPVEASAYWDLLTMVHTIWDDPDGERPLRAVSPWGTTTFYVVDVELYAYFVPASDDLINNLQGKCRHFALWDRQGTANNSCLNNINEKHFFDACFAVHIQERVAKSIYDCAYRLVTNSGVMTEKSIEAIPEFRSRDTYKNHALRLLEAYLAHHCPDDFHRRAWDDPECDILQADRGLLDAQVKGTVRGETDLKRLLSTDYRELNNPFIQEYQILVAIKLRLLIGKAAVYDDRFYQCQSGTLWIG